MSIEIINDSTPKENTYTKKIQEKSEFINPEQELKLNYLVQKTYHMKQDIERVCY